MTTCRGENNPQFRHGGTGTPEYTSWKKMRERCLCQTNRLFPFYGGRGIAICPEWDDFASFLADMGPRPEGSSLDRIDNDGNYEPGNCRWATPQQQSRNRRITKMVKWKGETRPLSEWAEILEIPYKTLFARMSYGWSVEKTFSQPLNKNQSARARGVKGMPSPYFEGCRA